MTVISLHFLLFILKLFNYTLIGFKYFECLSGVASIFRFVRDISFFNWVLSRYTSFQRLDVSLETVHNLVYSFSPETNQFAINHSGIYFNLILYCNFVLQINLRINFPLRFTLGDIFCMEGCRLVFYRMYLKIPRHPWG